MSTLNSNQAMTFQFLLELGKKKDQAENKTSTECEKVLEVIEVYCLLIISNLKSKSMAGNTIPFFTIKW